jgi:hypothetical protein
MPCHWWNNIKHFEGTSEEFFLYCMTLQMQALQSIKTSRTAHPNTHHIPEDLTPQTYWFLLSQI